MLAVSKAGMLLVPAGGSLPSSLKQAFQPSHRFCREVQAQHSTADPQSLNRRHCLPQTRPWHIEEASTKCPKRSESTAWGSCRPWCHPVPGTQAPWLSQAHAALLTAPRTTATSGSSKQPQEPSQAVTHAPSCWTLCPRCLQRGGEEPRCPQEGSAGSPRAPAALAEMKGKSWPHAALLARVPGAFWGRFLPGILFFQGHVQHCSPLHEPHHHPELC